MLNSKPTKSIERSSHNLTVLAWILILIGWEAPAIFYHFFVPVGASESYIPSWMNFAQLVFYAGFWIVAQFYSPMKPLRGFTLALFALKLGSGFIQPAIRHSSIYASWLSEASWGMQQLGIYGLKLISVMLMVLTLIGSGIGRRDLFVTRGEPSAIAKSTPFLPGLKEPQPWTKVARNFVPYYIVVLIVILGFQIRPDIGQITRALVFLPAIILASAINAFAEEFEARSMLLSRLMPAIGAGQAVLMTSVFFGLWHYGPTNNPSGTIGAIIATYLGWVAAKSMIETRGMVWGFMLHFLGDFVIFSFSAMAIA